MPAQRENLRRKVTFWNCSGYKTEPSAPRHTPIRDLRSHSRHHAHMVTLHNYAGSKRELHAIMKMLLFAPLAKARHVIENINESKLVTNRYTIDRLS